MQFTDSLKNLDLVKSVHGGNVDALPWQHASLRAIHKALGVAQLWDSLFVFQPVQPSELEYEPIWKFDIEEDTDANIQVRYIRILFEIFLHVTNGCCLCSILSISRSMRLPQDLSRRVRVAPK